MIQNKFDSEIIHKFVKKMKNIHIKDSFGNSILDRVYDESLIKYLLHNKVKYEERKDIVRIDLQLQKEIIENMRKIIKVYSSMGKLQELNDIIISESIDYL